METKKRLLQRVSRAGNTRRPKPVDHVRVMPPAPEYCPACKLTGCYAKLKRNAYYCPHCWNLFGSVFYDPNTKNL